MKQKLFKTYLEFRDSNWYCYWDGDSNTDREFQRLSAWYIGIDDNFWEFSYTKLKERLLDGSFLTKLKESNSKITEKDARDSEAASFVFIKSVEAIYPK